MKTISKLKRFIYAYTQTSKRFTKIMNFLPFSRLCRLSIINLFFFLVRMIVILEIYKTVFGVPVHTLFSNPGTFPQGLTLNSLKGISIPSNPIIALPTYLAGYIVRFGTGTTIHD
jgi:hypothetical protein